jgi:uncharacterized membrane protein YeiH
VVEHYPVTSLSSLAVVVVVLIAAVVAVLVATRAQQVFQFRAT